MKNLMLKNVVLPVIVVFLALGPPAGAFAEIKVLDFDDAPLGPFSYFEEEGFSLTWSGYGDRQAVVNVGGDHQNILRDAAINHNGAGVSIERIGGGSFYFNSLQANNAGVVPPPQGSTAQGYWCYIISYAGDEIISNSGRYYPYSSVWQTYYNPTPNTPITRIYITMMSLKAIYGMDNINLSVLDPLVADAGPDQAVSETPGYLPLVQLNGCASEGSSNPPEDLTFEWTQVAGPPATLSDPAICDPTFTAPLLPAQTVQVLTFKLVVSDGQLTSEDFVDITVNNNNHAPVCGVPDPFEVAEGSPGVQLDGSASYDPDDDTLTYSWVQVEGPQSISLSGAGTATASFDAPWIIGGGGDTLVDEAYLFTLTISDGQLASSCDVIAVVNNLNHCPTADAGQNQVVAEGEPYTLTGAASSDPDNDLLLCAWQQTYGPVVTLDDPASCTPSFVAPWVGAGGSDLVFQLTVDDQYGCTDTATVTIHVDNVGDPPTCVGARATIAQLWPPNHKMVEVGIENIGTGNLPTTIAITGVMQDELSEGLGDGDTACDAVISEDATKVMLRAERAGTGNGRVYHVAFTATNEQGSCSGVVQVSVPKNRKKGQVAVDDGPLYPSCP